MPNYYKIIVNSTLQCVLDLFILFPVTTFKNFFMKRLIFSLLLSRISGKKNNLNRQLITKVMNQTIEAKVRSVASNIRKIREYRDYTQEYLAMKLGISQNAYSKIELAYTRITLERLIQIAQILEVDSVDLLNISGEDLIRLHTNQMRIS